VASLPMIPAPPIDETAPQPPRADTPRSVSGAARWAMAPFTRSSKGTPREGGPVALPLDAIELDRTEQKVVYWFATAPSVRVFFGRVSGPCFSCSCNQALRSSADSICRCNIDTIIRLRSTCAKGLLTSTS
jgi:hypothetical protein